VPTPSGDIGTPARGRRSRPRVWGPGVADGTRRPLALLLVVAAVGFPIVLSRGVVADSPKLSGTPPYPIPSAPGATLSGASWDIAGDLGGPAALLYVSDRCPHCRAELRTWGSLKGWEGAIQLWIVASPRSELEALGWVPPRLRGQVVSDADGFIAKALGVQAVPATLWVDSGGVVRDQWLGRSSSARIEGTIRRLTGPAFPESAPEDPGPTTGPGAQR
jgi:hypothetical protein